MVNPNWVGKSQDKIDDASTKLTNFRNLCSAQTHRIQILKAQVISLREKMTVAKMPRRISAQLQPLREVVALLK